MIAMFLRNLFRAIPGPAERVRLVEEARRALIRDALQRAGCPSPRDDRESHPLFLTLHREPKRNEEFDLMVQGEEVPRNQYRVLRDITTGDLVVYKPDATWGDCANCGIRYRLKEGPRKPHTMMARIPLKGGWAT